MHNLPYQEQKLHIFYKWSFSISFILQTILTNGYFSGFLPLKFSHLGIFAALTSAFVLGFEVNLLRDVTRRNLCLFVGHYGTYAFVGFLMLRFILKDLLIDEKAANFRVHLGDQPSLLFGTAIAAFLLSDYLSWLVHFGFHKARCRFVVLAFLCHLTHHSMDKMRFSAVRHNAVSVFFALAPTAILINFLEATDNVIACATLVGLLVQLSLNAILTPFQHARFNSALSNTLEIAVGFFHAQHHDDRLSGSRYNFSVGIFSFWDRLMGTAMPIGPAAASTVETTDSAESDAIYGNLGSAFAGDSKTVSQAFTLAQLGPLKAYR